MRKTGDAATAVQSVLRRGPARRCWWRHPRVHAPRSSAHGFRRVEARFVGQAFSLHRHAYTIGLTLEGVQTLGIGARSAYACPASATCSRPTNCTTAARYAAPFAYRIAYVDPRLVQAQLGGSPLPFVTDPVVRLTDAQRRHLSPV